jgi:hypothetical protein
VNSWRPLPRRRRWSTSGSASTETWGAGVGHPAERALRVRHGA